MEFGRALKLADLAFVTDVYAAREAPIPGISGELIAGHAEDAGAAVHYLADRATVTARVAEQLRAGDVCITLGAGDLDEAARELVETLSGAGAA